MAPTPATPLPPSPMLSICKPTSDWLAELTIQLTHQSLLPIG